MQNHPTINQGDAYPKTIITRIKHPLSQHLHIFVISVKNAALHKFSLLSLHELCEQFQIGGTVERRELRDVLLLQRKEGGFVDAQIVEQQFFERSHRLHGRKRIQLITQRFFGRGDLIRISPLHSDLHAERVHGSGNVAV